MELTFETGALLLLIAAVVAMLTRRLRVPYSVGLVAAGMVLALLPFSPNVPLTKDLLFTALLPPLIFEAAFGIRWEDLRRDLPVILVLATLGVLISAGITAFGMHHFAGWEWPSALAFGVLVAATDPVSVTATFRQAKARGRLPLCWKQRVCSTMVRSLLLLPPLYPWFWEITSLLSRLAGRY